MRRYLPICSCLLLAAVPLHGWAMPDDADLRNRVVVVENVRLDYAQVLNVEPVYQTLRATRTEQQCEPEPASDAEDGSRLSRVVDSVKDIFSSKDESAANKADTDSSRNCRIVEVPREFRRPIAYDVDYVYKGTKYRSRVPDDPGNRLRIRVSVTPYIPGAVMAPTR